ncbi:MAG: DUF929 family protein [Thermoplasmata archaeon]
MVDWDRVEELRGKGWDWDRIADDSKVAYQAPRGVTDKGRALRTLYAKRARTASREPVAEQPLAKQNAAKESKWTLARFGMLFTPLTGIWFLIAYFVPSPVGVFISAIPVLGLALAGSCFLLAFGLLRTDKKWTSAFRGALAGGIILGLVVSASFGIGGLLAGYPTLTGVTSPQPDNFHFAGNPLWTDDHSSSGKPVYFFFGSAACPYCSASSWAEVVALERFGTLTGTVFDYSNPNDVYPNTPEEVLASAQLTSNYIALQVAETTYTGQIILPGFANEYQNAYFVAYDSGGSIPFIVIGGQYFTVGTLVNPADLAGMSTATVASAIATQSGPAWNAISPAADWLTAYMLKVDGGQPASLLAGNVLSDYGQIS